jgi:hypothetical protein
MLGLLYPRDAFADAYQTLVVAYDLLIERQPSQQAAVR